jgi:dTMP kinase
LSGLICIVTHRGHSQLMKGKFITIEGIEGAGKSSCIGFLREHICAQGKGVVETREPGGTHLGEALRDLLLGHQQADMSKEAELLLMFAARAQHLQTRIIPALQQGDWVLCDRFTDATYAYQGGGRGIAAERIAIIEDWVQGGLRPDLSILLDIPVAQGLERARQRASLDRFESESLVFFEAVRQRYLQIAREHPERVMVVDASVDREAVRRQLLDILTSLTETH